MGILDDAIREHLELKRQHGAEPGDLARLEKEAFGPATRPGDEPAGDQPPQSEAELGDVSTPVDEEPTRLIEPDLAAVDEVGEDEAEAPPELESSSSGFFDHLEDDPFDGPEGSPEADEDASEVEAAATEQARITHADLGDTVDHPVVTSDDDAEPFESEIFGAEDDLDLDLSLDDEPVTEAPLEPEYPSPLEEEPQEEPELLAEDEPSAPPEPAAPDAAPAAGTEEDEDLLEETPEFLESAPEGERLWFEQGEPKDFDF